MGMMNLNHDLVARLRECSKPNSDLMMAASQMQQVASRIGEAVGAPFRPAWGDPATLAKGIFSDQYDLLMEAAAEIEKLRVAVRQKAA